MKEENSDKNEKESANSKRYPDVLHSTAADLAATSSGQSFLGGISPVVASTSTSGPHLLESHLESLSTPEPNFPTFQNFVATTLEFSTSQPLSSKQASRYEIKERYEPMGSENTDVVINPLPLPQTTSSASLSFFSARSQLADRPPLIGQSETDLPNPPIAPLAKEEDSGGSSGSSSDTLSRRVRKILEGDSPSLSPRTEELLIDLTSEEDSQSLRVLPPSEFQVPKKHGEDGANSLMPDPVAESYIPANEESSSLPTHSDQRVGSPTSVSSKLEWDNAADIGYRQVPAPTLLNRSEPEGGSFQAPGPPLVQLFQDACVQTDVLLTEQRDAQAQTSFSKKYGSSSSMGSTSSQSTVKVIAPAVKLPQTSVEHFPTDFATLIKSIRLPSSLGQRNKSPSSISPDILRSSDLERRSGTASKTPLYSHSSDSHSDSSSDNFFKRHPNEPQKPELRDMQHPYGRESSNSDIDMGAGHSKFTQTNISFLAQRQSQINAKKPFDSLPGLSAELQSLRLQPPRASAASSSSYSTSGHNVTREDIKAPSQPNPPSTYRTSQVELLKHFEITRNRVDAPPGVAKIAPSLHRTTPQDKPLDFRDTIPKQAAPPFYLSSGTARPPSQVPISSLPLNEDLAQALKRGPEHQPPSLGVYPEHQPALGPDKPARYYSTFRPYYIMNKTSQQANNLPEEVKDQQATVPKVPEGAAKVPSSLKPPQDITPHQQARQEFEKLQKWVHRQRKSYLNHLMRDFKHFNRLHTLATRSTNNLVTPQRSASSYPSSDSSGTSWHLQKHRPSTKSQPRSKPLRSDSTIESSSSSSHPPAKIKETLSLKDFGQTFPTPISSSTEDKRRHFSLEEKRTNKKTSVGIQALPLEEIQNIPHKEKQPLPLAWEIPPTSWQPAAPLTLQSAFQQRCHDLITRSKQRTLYVRVLEQQRMTGEQENQPPPGQRPQVAPPLPPPRRIISHADMRARTERRYRNLAEVAQRKELNQRKNEYKSNRQAASAFVKKLQWNTLHGRVTFGLAPIQAGARRPQ